MSLVTNLQDLATRIATEVKTLRTLVNGNALDNSALITTSKTNLVAAINEVAAAAANASGISDTGTSTTTAWSSSKTNTEIQNKVAAVVDSAPGTLDTLNELAAALGDDPNFAASISTALGNRVRFDAVQALTGPQQVQARANIGAGTSDLVIGTTGTTAAAGNDSRLSDARTPTVHTHTAANISDSTATGRSLITATDATTARTAIGAGTSSLIIGTTGTTAKAGDYAPPTATTAVSGTVILASSAEATTGTDALKAITPATLKTVSDTKAAVSHTHTSANISDSTTVGRAVLVAVDAAAARTAIGAGTSNLTIGTTSSTAKAGDYAPPAASDILQGVVELATAAEVTTGTDTARAVTPAGLKVELDKKSNVGHTHTAAEVGAAPTSHTHTASNISDSTVIGRTVLTATDATAVRTAIGAGTSNYVATSATETAQGVVELATAAETTTGTDATRAVHPAGLKVELDKKALVSHTHTAANISDSTVIGRGVLTATDATAVRTLIGAGTSNLVIGTGAGTAADAAAVGNTNTNFVTIFEAGLV